MPTLATSGRSGPSVVRGPRAGVCELFLGGVEWQFPALNRGTVTSAVRGSPPHPPELTFSGLT